MVMHDFNPHAAKRTPDVLFHARRTFAQQAMHGVGSPWNVGGLHADAPRAGPSHAPRLCMHVHRWSCAHHRHNVVKHF